MTASVPDAPADLPASGRGSVALSLHPVKPKLRGWLHLGMFPAVLIAGLVLTALADSSRGRMACGIYVLTACLLFGVSALYHRGNWSPRMDGILRRLDHANIFLIIAGTYTCLLYTSLMCIRDSFWVGAPRWLYTPCYIAMGWAAVFFLPDFMRSGGIAVLVLVIVGGLLYSAGGVIYGIKRPNPSPRWFGFHEVFHSFTLAAFVVHYVGISLVAYQHG